jgi:hypothetical protein
MRRGVKAAVVMVLFIATLLLLLGQATLWTSISAEPAELTDGRQLAERYAPYLQFSEGEPCYPVDVDYYLESCSLYRIDDQNATLVTDSPTIPELSQITAHDYFLNNRLGAVNDQNIIDAYQQNLSQLGYTIYYHITTHEGMIFIQYWMFYVFNPATMNRHQGDWEMVQVILDADERPVATTYSQHHGGVRATWSEVIVHNDVHPQVYIALGSHANYYRYYQGKLQGMDHCDDNGLSLEPQDYELIEMSEAVPGGTPDTSWVWFGGRWGTIPDIFAVSRGEAGPPGPMYREDGRMWDGAAFYSDARQLNESTLWVEIVLYYSTWIIVGVVLFIVFLTILRVLRKRKRGELESPYLELLNVRKKGRRRLANILALAGLAVAMIGLTYPVFTMEAWVISGSYATNGYVTLFSLGGVDLLMINTLDPNGELLNIGAVLVNFALILGSMVLLFVLTNLASTPKKVARRYIAMGMILTFICMIFLLVIVFVGDVVAYFNPSGGSELANLLMAASKKPWGGSATIDSDTFGEINFRWGLDWGSLILPAGMALIGAGLIMRTATKNGAIKKG